MNSIYLDYAAATPMDVAVLEAMKPYFTEKFYNPSSLYLASKEVSLAIAEARSQIAATLGVRPGEVYFTAGGTEANNLAIKGVMEIFPSSNLIVSSIEHESVRLPAHGYKHKEAAVNDKGFVDVSSLERQIDDETVLISVMYANNEVGAIQPIKDIAALVSGIRRQRADQGNKLPLYLHTDACQAMQYLEMHAARLGVDLMTINGGKIYGPKQSGILYAKGGTKLAPQISGGGQEFGLRSGTENVPAIIGLAEACKMADNLKNEEVNRLKKLQAYFIKSLQDRFDGIIINGPLKNRLPNNVHVTFPGRDNERLIMELDERGVQASAGSACSASSDEPSHVLTAMGRSADEARASLRFTMGRNTDEPAIKRSLDILSELII